MSIEARYARYCIWCLTLRLEPAPYSTWVKEVAKIGELRFVSD